MTLNTEVIEDLERIVACSDCFNDPGLKLEAFSLGNNNGDLCPNCSSTLGAKLSKSDLEGLSHIFFVSGSRIRSDYGGANAIQFNEHHNGIGDIEFPPELAKDAQLIATLTEIGFFYYGPRLWMIGEIEPLKLLQIPEERDAVINSIIETYPIAILKKGTTFYRLRINPNNQNSPDEYDSAPDEFLGSGRLDSKDLPILYGSFDIEACLHECRVTIEQDLYLCTLKVAKDSRLLDLTVWPQEDGITEFESLSLSIHMIFRAPAHAYEIIRAIALAAKNYGYDGILYPSYFTRIHRSEDTVQNIALFGLPIRKGAVSFVGVNRLMLKKVAYEYHFGPGDF